MNKLFAVLMSFQLIIAPVALAQTTTSGSTTGVSSTTDTSKATASKDSGDQFRANAEAKTSNGGYKNQILGMVIGIFGAGMLLACGNGALFPSVVVFNAGGLIYIMSELLGGKAHNDYLKKKTEDLKMVQEKMKASGGGGEVQKAALESALANEKEILKFINKRKMWMSAVSLIFTAATAAAALEFIVPTPLSPLAVVPMLCVGGPAVSMPMVLGITAAYSFVSGGGMIGAFGAALGMYALTMIPIHTSASVLTAGRLAFFAASTMIVGSIKSDLSKKADVAKGNIDMLQKALDQFNANSTNTNGLAQDSSTNSNGDTTNIDPLTGKPYAFNTLPEATKGTGTICAAAGDKTVDISTSACSNPLKLKSPTFDASLNVPTLQLAGQLASDMGTSLNSGDLAGAEVSAAKLNAQAGRINQVKDDLIKQVNSKLKAAGKPTIDLDASAKAQLNAMSNALSAKDPQAAGMLASLAGGKASLGDDLKGEADLKENKQTINSTADANAAKASAVDPNAAAAAALAAAGYGGLTEGGISADELAKKQNKSMDQALNEFESSESDISKHSDTNLFKQLSNRYLLNYNKIFDKKKEDPVAEPSKK